MTHDEVIAALMTMLEIPLNQSDDNFTRIQPAMFDYAEGRILGDLNWLVTNITQQVRLNALMREFPLPSTVRILENINVLTPSGTLILPNSKRNTLERISAPMLDMLWPQESFKPGMPQKYALIGTSPQAAALQRYPALRTAPMVVPSPPSPPPQSLSYVLRFMPTPDRAYPAELLGTIHPERLSPTNDQTFLSVNYPELLLAACMVFGCGYQRDFGAQADDPTRAMSWDAQYKTLLQGVQIEHARMRGEGPGFTPMPPAPVAQLPR